MSSSKLSVGIVGLPNVGKSTLFNALLKRQQAYVANFPFATIEPNVGIVPVPDRRLEFLAETVASQSMKSEALNSKQITNPNYQFRNKDSWPPIVPATVEFIDIAGLIAGAHKGEGLGNKFLSHIREVDAIAHVVRAFRDTDIVKEGSVDPQEDLKTIETELMLADLETLEKQKDLGNTPDKEVKKRFKVAARMKEALEKEIPARDVKLDKEEKKIVKSFCLLTSKPTLVVLNVNEEDLREANKLELAFAAKMNLHSSQIIAICAKVESELAVLDRGDQKNYLTDLGVKSSGLERFIKKAFETLGLITFLTAREKEVRAWTIRDGSTALEASEVIHTDFMKNFIKADVVNFKDFINPSTGGGGWKMARELGRVRSEGKQYVVKDGDVIEFKVGM